MKNHPRLFVACLMVAAVGFSVLASSCASTAFEARTAPGAGFYDEDYMGPPVIISPC
ncbi:hypothetical protein NT6N_32630 [Oceaniferula spumae]|uniref:Lipoprotein n=1 Tax=Oceaniferula spumae TaxID=2979115 RepID=A0AAT9FQH1_9BACT